METSTDYGYLGVLRGTGGAWFLNGEATYQLDSPWAFGSGAEYAIAAMDHGSTAVQAVKYASTRDLMTNSIVQKYVVPTTNATKSTKATKAPKGSNT